MFNQTRKRILLHVFLRILILLFYSVGIIRPALAQGSGYTLSFDGISEYVDVGNQVVNGCRTIEMWFKPASDITSTLNEPISLIIRDFNNGSGLSTNEFGLYFAPSSWQSGVNTGRLVFLRRAGTTLIQIATDNNYWPAGHWYHVAATIDPVSGMRMYINGVLQAQTDPSTSAIGTQTGTPWDNVSIGRWGSQNARYFEGEIDEVRIWETTRSVIQIRDRMCSSLLGNEAGLRAYWNFDGGTGAVLTDNSLNSYDGTITNMNNANWIYSGAPIGNISTYTYPGNLTGTSLSLNSGPGDEVLVNNINSSAVGIQLYKVNSLPNVTTNVNMPFTGNYYGVFLTSISGTYNFAYNFANYGCSACDEIFARNDNAVLNWQNVGGSQIGCLYSLVNESSVGYDYRSEYILNTGTNINPNPPLGNDTTLCAGSSLTLDPQIQNASYLWQDNSSASSFTVSQPGTYWVEINTGCGVVYDTITIDFTALPAMNLGNDTLLCQSANLLLDPGLSGVSYLWQDNSTGPTFNVTQSGIYSLSISNLCGQATDSIQVEFGSVPNVNLGADQTICENIALVLDASTPFSNYLWQDGSTNSSYLVNQSGMYWVQVTNLCGVDRDTINISVLLVPELDLGPDTIICEGSFYTLLSPNGSGVLWSDNSFGTSLNVSQSGLYYGTLTENGCSSSDTVWVNFLEAPVVNLGVDTLICEKSNLFLNPGAVGSYEWNTGSAEPTLFVSDFGVYYVTVTNACGSASDTIEVGDLQCDCTYYVPNCFTPDGGQLNDEFGMVYDCALSNFRIQIYDRWGELIFESYDPAIFWDGTYRGRQVQDGTYVYKIRFDDDDGLEQVLTGHVTVLY